jgi:septum formation protein
MKAKDKKRFSPPLILASKSPRRKEILGLMGIPFRQCASTVAEDKVLKDPRGHVLNYSFLKAHDVARRIKRGVVLGADTVVVLRGKIYGKPASPAEARAMLRRLSGRMHQVMTGMTLIDTARGRCISGWESTDVRFRRLTGREIDWYVGTGEPLDKAGAYGIQEKGCFLVEKINGCFFNVVGLPVAKLLELLAKIGYPNTRRKSKHGWYI